MTEQEILLLEKEIYRDLSPIQNASRQLTERLPADGRVLSDEAWHFFHFEMNDFAVVGRTIESACTDRGWETPVLLSMDEFIQKVYPMEGKMRRELSYEEIMDHIRELDGIKENKRVFVYASHMDTGAVRGTANTRLFQAMEAFCLYCAKERRDENSIQVRNRLAFREQLEVPYYNRLFFVSYGSTCILPDNLRNSLCTITYPSLNAEDFRSLLWEYHLRKERYLKEKRVRAGLPAGEIRGLRLNNRLLEWYANRMSGLEEVVVRRLLSSMDGAFITGYADYTDQDTVDAVIVDYKNRILKQHERLEVILVKKEERVTGLDTIETWLEDHKKSIGSYKDSPTGILLVGIPGTGKSATAKEASKRLNLPLVQMDMARILGGRMGDSEKGMREMLNDLRFVAPCVLWIDEIEKAMSGSDGKSGDGGTIQRLFGMLLTFIQDNDRPVFTVTTANNISKLPPEFFRNGRFNQAFCLMMPDYNGCREIMKLKLNKYADEFGWKHEFQLYEAGRLFNQCVGTPKAPRFLTGADIEAHVQELFWKCESDGMDKYPGIKDMESRMYEISKQVRAQAQPCAPYTMEALAECYLDMIQRGLTMAGNPDSPYKREKLDLDKIRYYSYDNDTYKNEIPLCLEEPDKYKRYKSIERIPKEEKENPADWYDARFFYELVPVMSKVVFLDQEITMPETRSEYWKLMRDLVKKKQS